MIIRKETKADYGVVENLIRDAFWNVHVPGAAEHYLAHVMREYKDFVAELDMVAEVDGKIVGSIMYTIGKLCDEKGNQKDCLSFGPIAVAPEYQRKGIGKALIEYTVEKAKALGYESIVIFGHPCNYVARGFKSCKRFNVCVGDGIFPCAMLVKELADGAFDGRRWSYEESPVCQIELSDAEEFDKLYPYKEKQTLPSQEEFYIYSHSTLN